MIALRGRSVMSAKLGAMALAAGLLVVWQASTRSCAGEPMPDPKTHQQDQGKVYQAPPPPASSQRPSAKAPAAQIGTLLDGQHDLTEDDVYAAYQRGLFIETFVLATQLAGKGVPQAMTMIGHLYEVGQGVRQDLARAVTWFQLAADRGDREAQVELGLLYLEGHGVKRDRSRAYQFFEAAAQQNQPTAEFNLAILLIEGTVVHPDVDRARDLMRRAAEQGNAEAAYSYALMLEADNLPTNDKEITYWMGIAARAGQVPGEVEYAIRLAKGQGAEQDLDTAVLFLNRAAWAGNPVAQNRVAHLIATGVGLPFDTIEAAKWHLIAKSGGVQDPQLEDLLASMKPDELARAKDLAAQWPNLLPDPGPMPLLQPNQATSARYDLRGPLDFPRIGATSLPASR